MKKGPVLSRTYDLIKGGVSSTNSDMVKWSEHFSPREGNDIKLFKMPDMDVLSKRETNALERSLKEISHLIREKGEIADALHQKWPEWKDPGQYGKGSIPLTLEEVLSEVLDDESQVERTALEICSIASAKAALQVSR